ncbi:MAG: hypothetical protein ABF301_07055 [Sulfurovum sp.]|jgi:hypothetical protein
MQKEIVVGGFSKEQREQNLEKIKTKYTKKGYKFLKYIDNGTLKSVAVFDVDESILRKEKSKNLYILSGFFLLLSLYLFLQGK